MMLNTRSQDQQTQKTFSTSSSSSSASVSPRFRSISQPIDPRFGLGFGAEVNGRQQENYYGHGQQQPHAWQHQDYQDYHMISRMTPLSTPKNANLGSKSNVRHPGTAPNRKLPPAPLDLSPRPEQARPHRDFARYDQTYEHAYSQTRDTDVGGLRGGSGRGMPSSSGSGSRESYSTEVAFDPRTPGTIYTPSSSSTSTSASIGLGSPVLVTPTSSTSLSGWRSVSSPAPSPSFSVASSGMASPWGQSPRSPYYQDTNQQHQQHQAQPRQSREKFVTGRSVSSSGSIPLAHTGATQPGWGKGEGRRMARSVMFAEEPVSRIHTPPANAHGGKKDKYLSRSGSGSGNGGGGAGKIKGFFGGWKRKPSVTDPAIQVNADVDASSNVAEIQDEQRARSMFVRRTEPVRSNSADIYPGPGRASFSHVPLETRQVQSVEPETYDPAKHSRRRTTSALGSLGTTDAYGGVAPMASPRSSNRKTSVVQRSDSSFSVHSEGGVETYCESPTYFSSHRRQPSDETSEDEKEDDEDRQEVEQPTPTRTRLNPRISIALPGSSFNLGLDFGLPSSDTIQGTSLASLIEDEEPAPSPVLPDRFLGSGSNPTTPVMKQEWETGVSAPKPVARSSTRKSQSKRSLRSPSITLSPAETVKSEALSTPQARMASPTKVEQPYTPPVLEMPRVISLNSPLDYPASPLRPKQRSSSRRTSLGSSGSQLSRARSIVLDSPTLPVSPNRPDASSDAFEDCVAERPVRRSSLLRDGRAAPVDREVLARASTDLRRQPTRRRMKSSGSIASLMSITFGTDGAEAASTDDLPMFRVIPATPVGGTETFEPRPRSADETELAAIYKATPRQLDNAVDLSSSPPTGNDSVMGLAESAFPPLPAVKPLVIRSNVHPKMAPRSSSSDGRLEHDTSFSSTSTQSPSLTSLTTASSSMSLSTLEDDEKVFQSILAGFDDVRLEDTTPYQAGDRVDPLRQIKAELDEEIRSWSSMSLESHDDSPDGEHYGHAMHGLGFELYDDRSTTPINRVQPLRSKTEMPIVHKAAITEDETTPRPDRYCSGFPESTKLWQDRRISETSVNSSGMSSYDSNESMTDTDLDSLMSDIDDLHSASIAVVASKTSAMYASPRQVEFRNHARHQDVPEEEVMEDDDSAARWENADEDEVEIGWAM